MFKFYTKLVILFSTIGILPLLILGLLTYNISISIKDDLIKANMQILFQTQMRVEETLKMIDNAMIQFINSPTVTKLISCPRDNSYFVEFRDAAAYMYRMQTFETEISNLFLISNLKKWIISNTLMNDINDENLDENLIDFVNQLNAIPKTSFWYNTATYNKNNHTESIGAAPGIFLVKKIPVNTINSDGLAMVQLPKYSIDKLITGENPTHKIVILDESGAIVSSDSSLFINGREPFQHVLSTIITDDNQKGYFIDKIAHQDYMVIFNRSNYNNWTYISFAPASQVFHKSNSIKNLTLIIIIGMLTFVLTLSVKGSQGLYLPVKKLYKLTQNNDDYVNKKRQTRDEFKVINDTVEELISTNEKYRDEITQQGNTVKLFFFRRLLQGEIEKKQIKKNLDNYLIPYRAKSIVLMGIKPDSFQNIHFQDDKELLLFAIGNILIDLIDTSKSWIPVLLKDEYFILLLSNEPQNQFKDTITKLIQTIQYTLNFYLNLSMSIGVSSIFGDIEQITVAKVECDEALKYCIKNGSGSVTFMDTVKTSKFTNSITLSDKKNDLLLAIKSGNIQESESCFEVCLHDITTSELDINMFQFEVISLIIDIVKTIHIIDSSFEFSIDNFLSKFHSIDEMVGYIKSYLIVNGCNKYNDYRSNVKKSMIEQIIEYVNANLSNDISLESCAQHLNYSANYISRVFKAEMSVKFSEYVTLQKIELVKDWLSNTDLSINEISKKLSYNNPQNFIRSFKKVTGITPGQYRETMLEDLQLK